MAPIRMAPPTPTTTPITIFFSLEERPELPELSAFPLREGDSVAEASVAELVIVVWTGVPLMV